MPCNLQWREVLTSAKTLITYFLFTSCFRERSEYCSSTMLASANPFWTLSLFSLFRFILAGNPFPTGQLNVSVNCSNKHEQDQNWCQNVFPQTPPLRLTQCIEAHQCLLLCVHAKMTPVRSACTLEWQKATWLLLLCHIHANKRDLSAPA